jgi:hypothetical protein
MNLLARLRRRWPNDRAQLREFVNQQLRLHQLYLDRHDVSGGDALDALAMREWSRADRRSAPLI